MGEVLFGDVAAELVDFPQFFPDYTRGRGPEDFCIVYRMTFMTSSDVYSLTSNTCKVG